MFAILISVHFCEVSFQGQLTNLLTDGLSN